MAGPSARQADTNLGDPEIAGALQAFVAVSSGSRYSRVEKVGRKSYSSNLFISLREPLYMWESGRQMLTRAFRTLRREGATVLMGGKPPDGFTDEVSTLRLGADVAEESRSRYFARFGKRPEVARKRRSLVDDDLEVGRRPIRHSSPNRPAVSTNSGTAGPPGAERPRRVPLAAVRESVEDSVESGRREGMLESGQCRPCIDSLSHLIDRHGVYSVSESVRAGDDTVLEANGPMHAVLARPVDGRVIQDLRTAFGIFVPLVARHGGIQYRFESNDRRRVSSLDDGMKTSWNEVQRRF